MTDNNVSIAENGGTLTLTATDSDSGTLKYHIFGRDSDYFLLSNALNDGSSSTTLQFVNDQDYETFVYPNDDTRLKITVAVTDGVNWDSKAFKIGVLDANDGPVFTSASSVQVDENQTSVIQLVATDQDGDTISYGISGGRPR